MGAGGAIFSRSGTTSLTNVTVSDNSATGGLGGATWADGGGEGGDGGDGRGGALFVDTGNLSMLNVTVADNSVQSGAGGPIDGGRDQATPGVAGTGVTGGIVNRAGTVNLKNTFIADNIAAVSPDIDGLFISQGHNLIEGPSGGTLTGLATGNIFGVDPNLQPLAENGGATQTHAIDFSSAAVDAGNSTGAPTTDQRGIPRRGATDIGAFEFHPFLVVNTNDSGPGSLRQAILENNASSGGNTITFQIGAVGSIQTIFLNSTEVGLSLPIITKPVFLDGWSQGGAAYNGPPLIEINGGFLFESAGPAFGLNIQSRDVIIRGFAFNNFANFKDEGVGIGVFNVSGNANVWIHGNYFGLGLDGLRNSANGSAGIQVGAGVAGVLIGSNSDGFNDTNERNLLAATSNGDGILLIGDKNSVFGNVIGLAADGSVGGGLDLPPVGNAGAGIRVLGSNNIIGGLAAGQANIISNNGGAGVFVLSGVGNTIRGNSIFANIGLGIDLGTQGQTSNDKDDADNGANRLQNFPEITDNQLVGNDITFTFNVPSSTLASDYPLTIDFYKVGTGSNPGLTLVGSVTYSAVELQASQVVTFTPLCH